MDAVEEEGPPPKKCLSLSRLHPPLVEATYQNHFAKPVEPAVLEQAAKGVVPSKTKESTQLAVKNFKCWVRSCSSSSLLEVVPPDLLCSHDPDLLCKWLCCFILEMRKTDGLRYPPATIWSFMSGLNRFSETMLPSPCWIRTTPGFALY